jgi:hypothetical protein
VGQGDKGLHNHNFLYQQLHTTLSLKSIEDEIGMIGMARIMQEAMHIRLTGSQTREEDVVTFETIDDVLEGMVIQDSDGQPESSSEDDWAVAQAETGILPQVTFLSHVEPLNCFLARHSSCQHQSSK